MSDLQTIIDGILSERKSRIAQISSQSDLIDSLYPNLQKMQKTISELGVEDAAEKVETISKFLSNLDQAREKLRLLKKRYEKSTINIGVSGFTHAGKSTLLQAISGLGDDAIPKADEGGSNALHATTAICSQIFNSPDKYAEIIYKNDKEFLEFVNAHLEVAGLSTISDKGEFAGIVIPDNKDSEEEKNTIKDRLRLLKESYSVYKDKIGNGIEKISGNYFNRLDSFVSYSKGDKNTRFFPAVKEVKIYCPFPALGNSDIKLCLVDLPGFGEFDKVDEIQTSNLREIVDHIIFIYKTNKDEGIVNRKYRESYSVIKHIHPSQSSNNEFLLNFLSFLINEDRTNEFWQNHVSQTIQGISDSYGNYKYYNFPAILNGNPNKNEAEQKLGDILTRLAESLPKMDECLLKSLGESLNVDEIRFLLKDLSKFVNQFSYQNDDPAKFFDKGVRFRENLVKKLESLLKSYQENVETFDEKFLEKISAISDKVDNEVSETMLYSSETKERETWEKYIDFSAKGDNASTFASELRRIWVEIISRYMKLDTDFSEHIDVLKKEIADIFNSMSGSLITKDENGDYEFEKFLDEKLSCLGTENAIYKAFASLSTLNQSFRQNLYPFIFREKLDKLMLTKANGGVQKLDDENFDLRVVENYKAQLVPICQNMNYEICKNIESNFVLSYFLIGALHTFNERLTYSKIDPDADFIKFCSVFRRSIYPDEYGSEADSVKVQELQNLIEQTKTIISKF